MKIIKIMKPLTLEDVENIEARIQYIDDEDRLREITEMLDQDISRRKGRFGNDPLEDLKICETLSAEDKIFGQLLQRALRRYVERKIPLNEGELNEKYGKSKGAVYRRLQAIEFDIRTPRLSNEAIRALEAYTDSFASELYEEAIRLARRENSLYITPKDIEKAKKRILRSRWLGFLG
jgi:histone H3/H4